MTTTQTPISCRCRALIVPAGNGGPDWIAVSGERPGDFHCPDGQLHRPAPADTEFPATWAGGHALVIEFGDEEFLARCQCGTQLGIGNPTTSLDHFGLVWEHHVMTREEIK